MKTKSMSTFTTIQSSFINFLEKQEERVRMDKEREIRVEERGNSREEKVQREAREELWRERAAMLEKSPEPGGMRMLGR